MNVKIGDKFIANNGIIGVVYYVTPQLNEFGIRFSPISARYSLTYSYHLDNLKFVGEYDPTYIWQVKPLGKIKKSKLPRWF